MTSPALRFFVFDVESIGLHGEGFAVAGGVYMADNGAALWEFQYACPPETAQGFELDREWVAKNVPVLEITHRHPTGIREAFWAKWKRAKKSGLKMAAECLWPVESRFLGDCLRDNANRLIDAPYPFHEISSIMIAAGMDPMCTYERSESEKPAHSPLADARQSARLLSEALSRVSEPIGTGR
jgi:hypothetical protein